MPYTADSCMCLGLEVRALTRALAFGTESRERAPGRLLCCGHRSTGDHTTRLEATYRLWHKVGMVSQHWCSPCQLCPGAAVCPVGQLRLGSLREAGGGWWVGSADRPALCCVLTSQGCCTTPPARHSVTTYTSCTSPAPTPRAAASAQTLRPGTTRYVLETPTAFTCCPGYPHTP